MWRSASEKKGWEILKRLAELKLASGGITNDPLGAADWDRIPAGLDLDVIRAHAFAETGDFALMLIIESAAEFGEADVRRRTWKAIAPEAGAYAALFVAHWLAASFAELARSATTPFTAEAHDRARHYLGEWFPWSESDDAAIRDLARRDDVGDARFELVTTALSRLVGGDAAAKLPALAPYAGFGPERFLADTHWQVCWNHAQLPYLRLADPEGLAQWQAHQAAP